MQSPGLELKSSSTSIQPPVKLYFADTTWLGARHDGYPLVSFQEYRALRLSESSSETHERRSFRSLAALHQSHLTFGLLEGVVEQKIHESLLLRQTETGDVVLSSANFSKILRDWESRVIAMRETDPQAQEKWFDRVNTTLQKAFQLMIVEVRQPKYSYFNGGNLQPDDVSNIVFTIAAIAEALTASRVVFLRRPPMGLSWSFITAIGNPYEKELITKGWCPFVIDILKNGLALLTYASNFKPYVRPGEERHTHTGCTREECTMNSINTTAYITRHVKDTCQCSYSKPLADAVLGALAEGSIPVIAMKGSESSPDTLELTCKNASTTPYVAISHVWADGLGSTTETGLPTCQVRRLASMTLRLVSGGCFWIDSVCIPARREMRKRAIGLMARTYKDAATVLVIDAGIRSCSMHAPAEERLLRILTSGWMQRVWTLQEAILAKTLVFEFSDGLVSIQELIPKGVKAADVIQAQLAGEVFRLSKRIPADGGRGLALGDVARSLMRRTTSKLEDETLAISGLLGVDALELVNLPPERRMMTLLLRVREVPSNIIFLSGSKMDEVNGFRWAPRTLMIRGGNQLDTGKRDAVCIPKGLFAMYSCIFFRPTTVQRGERWCVRDLAKKIFYTAYDVTSEAGSVSGFVPYTCSGLLFEHGNIPQHQAMSTAVATLINAKEAVRLDDDDMQEELRPTCEYKLRVMVSRIIEDEYESVKGEHKMIDIAGVGRAMVCMT